MRGAVSFRAMSRDFTLRFTTNALCRVEEITGRGFADLAAGLGTGFRITDLRVLFYAGANLSSIEEAGDVIDDIGFQASGELVGKAIAAAFPETEAAQQGKTAAAA